MGVHCWKSQIFEQHATSAHYLLKIWSREKLNADRVNAHEAPVKERTKAKGGGLMPLALNAKQRE